MSTSTITLDGDLVTLVPLPTCPAPKMIEPWVQDSVAIITSVFTGQTQAQGSTGADLWGMMVTYAPLDTALEAPPFLAWLLQMRGMSRAVQMAPPEYNGPYGIPSGMPLAGVANANLVADSSLLDVWECWSNPGVGWYFVAGPPAGGGTNAFLINSGTTGASVSNAIAVVPGQTYTFSCYIQAPDYTAGATGPVAVEVKYAGVFIPIVPPSAGESARYTCTFTVPLGVTSVNIWVSAQGSTWASGQLLVSSFQLQTGSIATAYVQSLSAALNGVQVAASTTLNTYGWTPNTFGLLLPYDCIQIGYRLHRVLDIVSSDANGDASFEIWPSLREDVAPGQQIITANPQGLFRLAQNKRNWSADYMRLTHLSFPLTEYR